MIPFTSDEQRYEYDLSPTSLVIDVGVHMGAFTREITRRYDCYVLGFEPILEFWEFATSFENPKVTILNCALGKKNEVHEFGVSGDSSGQWNTWEVRQKTAVMDACMLRQLNLGLSCDLMKLNCEGGEYDILERLIETGNIPWFANIQVQFHRVVEDYVSRRDRIHAALSQTHELTYCEPFIWESWQRK